MIAAISETRLAEIRELVKVGPGGVLMGAWDGDPRARVLTEAIRDALAALAAAEAKAEQAEKALRAIYDAPPPSKRASRSEIAHEAARLRLIAGVALDFPLASSGERALTEPDGSTASPGGPESRQGLAGTPPTGNHGGASGSVSPSLGRDRIQEPDDKGRA